MDRIESWQLIHNGSAEAFVESLIREAKDHPAVHHPYLRRLAAGDFPDVAEAVRDYAFQYSFYGAEFTSYVEGVIGGLKAPRHREALRENLQEEKGIPGSSKLEELPHTEIFRHFKRKTGVDDAYENAHRPCTTVLVWRDLFLQKCQSRQEGVGVGAIGLGTELVVPIMYSYLLRCLREHTSLTPEDYTFFTLHVECDAAHGQDLVDITVDLAESVDVREAIRFGVVSSLNLRKAFWDIMLSRAVSMKP